MHGLGHCKVMGVGFARTAYFKMQGLAKKIDRIKNALTRIVQSLWESVRVPIVINLQRLAHKIDRAGNARTRIVQN